MINGVCLSERIYILEDDPVMSKVLAERVAELGDYLVETFDLGGDLLEAQETNPAIAVLTDLNLPDMNGIEVTRTLRKADPLLPVFVVTSQRDTNSAVGALRAGATEYLTKPVNFDELETLITRSLVDTRIKAEAAAAAAFDRTRFSPTALLGDHAAIKAVREFQQQLAAIPTSTILLLGESGTGKNLVARGIHQAGPDADQGRFVEVNCSALPAQLLESELFGHQKGAFTDARQTKRGLVEVANHGTLFLDEIGDMPLPLQTKLLSFLESKTFRRVGGTEEIRVSLRIIAATNRDLLAMVKEGNFRQDLYYRLSVASHTLPSLREVKSDLPLMIEYYREFFAAEFRKNVASISSDASDALLAWDWPGNVRELRNVIERAMIFAAGDELRLRDLPDFQPMELSGHGTPNSGPGDEFLIPPNMTLAESEKEYIRQTMIRFDGSVQKAAEALGISRKNLWEKRKKYGLSN